MIESKLHATILAIYEAALEPARWDDVSERIADAMNSGGTHIVVVNRTTGELALSGSARMPPEVHVEYMRDYFPTDRIRTERIQKQPIGQVVYERGILSETEVKASAVINEFQPRFELANMVGANLSVQDHFFWLGTARGRTPRPYDPDELGALSALLPHLRVAARMGLELGDLQRQRGMLSGLYDARGRGVFLVDRAGVVAFASRLAETYLRSALVTVAAGHLQFADRDLDRKYRGALERVFALEGGFVPPPEAMIAVDPADGSEHGVRVSRILADNGGPHGGRYAAVTMFALDDRQPPDTDDVRRFGELYGLTGAECAVVGAVARLEDLAGFARARGIQTSTARNQLKAAMAKIGVRSQRHLLRRLDRFCFLHLH